MVKKGITKEILFLIILLVALIFSIAIYLLVNKTVFKGTSDFFDFMKRLFE
ncbi:MAG: hypothetical protein OH319_01590 [Candidatus Parvarchaeota archaeon]|nr:hypothetical protein [Candidatus Jingweiarchaeum tengchongense]MCW1297736.1 hypothetical protein [Candidatus Jingweiarchaeum tengchongense]MCW1299746.1 hypothetical protein [Candidatus Jingweiarchaeum tengchongense]MCW1304283.1 hypothetical protein [Candidatus Jingweiarchaeum tengchongense]MCW1305310.1 hypothetical protein [Candidatus Jingweiarchaeum tengchongense]